MYLAISTKFDTDLFVHGGYNNHDIAPFATSDDEIRVNGDTYLGTVLVV